MQLSAITDVKNRPKPIVLLVLDGWGLSPAWGGNAIGIANPPTMTYLWKYYPHAVLQAFRTIRGPDGVVGSSEIGHASLGSGRVVDDDLTDINLLIENRQFFSNAALETALAAARDAKKAVHLIGILSEGGIHGSLGHAQALIKFAKQVGVEQLFVHPIVDGRDSETQSAQSYLAAIEHTVKAEAVGSIATVIGRYYGMDRNGYWDRTAVAYRALRETGARTVQSAKEAISLAYREGLDDEHLPPTVIDSPTTPAATSRIKDGDTVIFWNFRADRTRQLAQAFVDPAVFRTFLVFRTQPLAKVNIVTMTDYHLDLPTVSVAYPGAVIESTVGALLANHQFSQLHVAESEKAAHVTYFFNGGRVEPYKAEDRVIVASPRVARYDLVPAMSCAAITKILERAIRTTSHDFIVANLANVDMLAHTGNLEATTKAVLVVDEAVRRVANAVIDAGGVLLVTADHGNAEQVATTKRGTRETKHTQNPVPFLYVAADAKRTTPRLHQAGSGSLIRSMLDSDRTLADVAPTILELFGIPKPSDMSGSSLLDKLE